MSFDAILADWRSTGRIGDANHAGTALTTFRASYPQAHDNLDRDPSIGDGLREELLEQLRTAASDNEGVVANRVQTFCRAHQCAGPRQDSLSHTCFGHVVERQAFENSLASCATPTRGLRRGGRAASALVDAVLRRDIRGQRSLLGTVFLKQWLMWSFYDALDPATPFRDVTKHAGELRRRLGLGQVDAGRTLLIWAHRLLAGQSAHLPTAFDAELNEFFRPGGKTEPLSGAGAMDEVVHVPVLGSQLEERIEPAVR